MCSSPWDSNESYMTEPLNGTELIITYKNFLSILFLSAVCFNCLVITWSSLDTKLFFFFCNIILASCGLTETEAYLFCPFLL